MLCLVLVAGHTVHSNKSWLYLAGVQVQPSELMKVLVIVALAKYYAEIDRDYLEFSDLLVGGLITAVPMLLILLQGDLGTAITFPPIFAGMSFLGGLKRKQIILLTIGMADAEGLPERAHSGGVQSNERSPGIRLSAAAVEDRHRIGPFPR